MQDNKRKKNNELINQGWYEMKTILDIELPVRKNKRRRWFILLFGLLFLSSGSLIWKSLEDSSLNRDDSSKDTELVNLKKTEVIINSTTEISSNKDNVVEDESLQTDEKNNELGNERRIAKKPGLEDNFKIAAIVNLKLGLLSDMTEDKTHNSGLGKMKRIEAFLDSNDDIVLVEKFDLKLKSTANPGSNSLEKGYKGGKLDISRVEGDVAIEKRVNEDKLALLDKLNGMIVPPLYYDDFSIDYNMQGSKRVIKNPNRRRLFYGIYAGIISQNRFLTNGYQFGFDANLKLNERFSLTASLGYTRLTSRKSSTIYQVLALDQDPENMDQFQYIITSSTANKILLSKNYFDFSIRPNFWLNRKMSLSIGPSVSVLLSAKNEEISTTGFYFNQRFLEEVKILKGMDLSLNMGFKYYIHHRFAVSLMYNHGLISLWDNPNSVTIEASGANLSGTSLIYENTGSNYNRYLGLRGYFIF